MHYPFFSDVCSLYMHAHAHTHPNLMLKMFLFVHNTHIHFSDIVQVFSCRICQPGSLSNPAVNIQKYRNKNTSKHTATNHGKQFINQKLQSIHPTNETSHNKSNFTHLLLLVSILLSVRLRLCAH